jgi:osmotically-inducible protein OsmY
MTLFSAAADMDSHHVRMVLAEKGITSGNFRVRAVNGTVYLFGRALSQTEFNTALNLARGTEDVRAVVNHVRVQP